MASSSFLTLLAQCLAMFVASFVVGSLPLMFKSASSGKRLKAISVLGMGILVGAALTIIIPEGVSTLYDSLPEHEDHRNDEVTAIGLSLLCGFAIMLLIESLTPHPSHSPPSTPASTPPSPTIPLPPHSGSDDQSRPVPQHMDSHTPMIPKRLHVRDSEAGKGKGGGGPTAASAVHGLNATLGMVIHASADGIALGASSLGSGSLGLIVFIAVLVHKGPTALGLTTTLLSLGLSQPMIRRRLFIFSTAAPIGAVITYFVVRAFGLQNPGGHETGIDGLMWWTGIALLFSGGSFLYVATVIQPLSSDDEHHHHPHDSEEDEDASLGKYARTALLVTGMVLPALLSSLVGDQD